MAAASGGSGPQIVDGCRDTGVVSARDPNGEQFVLFAGDYGADARSAEIHVVRSRPGGAMLTFHIALCQSSMSLTRLTTTWGYADGCFADITYEAHAARNRRTKTEQCAEAGVPVPREASSVALRSSELTVTDAAVRIRIPLSRIPKASRPRFAPGTRWSNPGVVATSAPLGLSSVGVQAGDVDTSAGSGWDAAFTSRYVVERPQR